MPPTFIFVRHGEAKHNVAFHATDEKAFEDEANRDAPLTELGLKQAHETAQNLSTLPIVDIWSSPLTRCIQTSQELFEETSAQNIYMHDNLLERQGGNHVCNERKLKSELKTLHPGYHTSFLAEKPAYWIERENMSSLCFRMLMFVLFLANRYADLSEDYHLLVVSHRDAIFSLTGKELQKAEPLILTLGQILSKDKNLIPQPQVETQDASLTPTTS
jgi:broad specificity phosphatase PhoE